MSNVVVVKKKRARFLRLASVRRAEAELRWFKRNRESAGT